MIRSRGILALPALVLAGAGFAFSQSPVSQPPLTFGSSIDVINLTVTVTDAQGRPVPSLGKEMFAVYEDGAKQDLVLFNKDRLPLSLILLMDASASMDDKAGPAKSAAKRFVSTLVPADRARVVSFNNRIEVLQDFTSDKAALNAGIDRLMPSGATALHNAFYISLRELQKEKGQAGTAPRRPAIILLSDGENTASIVTEDQVIELARRAEIGIYSIRITTDETADKGRAAFSQATHFLTALARDTGAQAFFPSQIQELDSVYDRIAEEMRTQYSLGYVPTNAKKDGRYRRIVVRVPSRDDVALRYKLGYFGPRS